MNRGAVLIMCAGVLWGTVVYFVHVLAECGFSSVQIAALRFTVAAVVYAVMLTVKDPKGWRIGWRGLAFFIAMGLCTSTFFTLCYFNCIQVASIQVAAVLLYLSPVWVALMSAVLFKERLTRRKVVALAAAVAGCALVSGIGTGAVTPLGVVLGLCSGFGFGLYSIFATFALRRYTTLQINAFVFVVASAATLALGNPISIAEKLTAVPDLGMVLVMALLMGVLSVVVPYILYNNGLKTTETSRAAILSTLEPVTAVVIGVAVLGEVFTIQSAVGAALVFVAIVILNTGKKNSQNVHEL